MKIYRLEWEKCDWNAYYCDGINYVRGSGVVYATTKDKAISNCPISEKDGHITITEVEVLE